MFDMSFEISTNLLSDQFSDLKKDAKFIVNIDSMRFNLDGNVKVKYHIYDESIHTKLYNMAMFDSRYKPENYYFDAEATVPKYTITNITSIADLDCLFISIVTQEWDRFSTEFIPTYDEVRKSAMSWVNIVPV